MGTFIVLAAFCMASGLLPPHVDVRPTSAPSSDAGKPVHISGSSRVAVLAPVLSTYAAIVGSLKNVRAVSKYAPLSENNGAFRFAFPGLSSLPVLSVIGVIPDPELVLRSGPDAVIVWRNHSRALYAAGYPGLVELDWTGKDGDDERLWNFLGKVLNEGSRAVRLCREAQLRRQALLARLPRQQAVTVLLMSPHDTASVWIGGKNYFLKSLLRDLRVVNVASDLGSGEFGPEQILRYDPDIILVPSDTEDDELSDIYGNPVWQALRTVRERRIYLIPHTSPFNLPVDETALLFWLAEILYPSLPHTTRDVYFSAYAEGYGYNLSDHEIDVALHLRKNAGAFGYERFRGVP